MSSIPYKKLEVSPTRQLNSLFHIISPVSHSILSTNSIELLDNIQHAAKDIWMHLYYKLVTEIAKWYGEDNAAIMKLKYSMFVGLQDKMATELS